MTTISIITQISIYDIFGEIGCTVNAMSKLIHARVLIVGGFGMAIFRIVCIEDLTKQIERKKLVKIIHLVEFAIIIPVTSTITILGKYYLSWENPILLYPFCKDYGLAKADIIQSHYEYDSENEEFGE